MTHHPCTAPNAFGYAGPTPSEPANGIEQDDKDAAMLAALDFAPWDGSDCPLPSNQQWIAGVQTHLFTLRLGFRILCQTKPELVATVEKLLKEETENNHEENALSALVDDLRHVREVMDGFSKLAVCANSRLLCALAVLSEREKAAA